jgi:hypothetical protein
VRGRIAICALAGVWAGCRQWLDLDDAPADGAFTSEGACPTYYADRDQDGHGDHEHPFVVCIRPSGVADNGDDCDDGDPHRAPGLPEVCDSIDNDCNGVVDDSGCATGCTALPRRPAPDDQIAYILCTDQVSAAFARTSCEQWGFHLAYVEDALENSWLGARASGSVWLGASNELQTDHWMWGSGLVFWANGTTLTFAAWASEEPGSPNEHCLAMRGDGWHDQACTDAMGFVCER